jgi:hypothetical protein
MIARGAAQRMLLKRNHKACIARVKWEGLC